MRFLPYQKRWILDESPLKLYEKTRRGGITYATSYRAVLKCLRRGSPFVQWVSSRDEITAREFITDYVAKWADMANHAVTGLDGSDIEVVDPNRGISARVVRFHNGARIYSLSSNPLAFAGKGGDVLVDEWDLHPDQAAVYDMAYPCITWGGQLELVSAYDACGSENTEFARLCRACRNGEKPHISFHRTTIEDAIREGFVETVNEIRKSRGMKLQTREEFLAQLQSGCRTREAFESQYMCIPNRSGGEQLILSADLARAESDLEILRLHFTEEEHGDAGSSAFWSGFFEGTPHAFGFDIARTGDLSSVWINRLGSGAAELRALLTFRNCRFGFQKDIVRAILDSGMAHGRGDKTGLGMAVCEELEDAFPDLFSGVNFSSSKLMLGTLMRSVFESGQQKIPRAFPEVRADLAAVRKISGGGGRLLFTETANSVLPESHCDLAWSCALALLAANETAPESENGFAEAFEERRERREIFWK